MSKKSLRNWLCFLPAIFLLASCVTTRMERRLDPVSEEFFSYVRYIITQEESRIFLELPPSARPAFIEEFWERRNPHPGSARNAFKEAYFSRIEEANRIFRTGGRPGWLQDRGRIYILFGPPDERQTQPMGGRPIDPYVDPREMIESQRVATGEKPTEVWVYYNLFSSFSQPHVVRLLFVDSHGAGDYRLATNLDEVIPGGIDSLLRPDLRFVHEMHKEEAARARLDLEKALFNFSWELVRQKDRALPSNLLIQILLPFRKIEFVVEEDRVRAELELEIQIRTESEEIVWEAKKGHELTFRKAYLQENPDGAWKTDIPVATWLEKGNYSVYLRLRNISGGQEIEKLLPLKM